MVTQLILNIHKGIVKQLLVFQELWFYGDFE